jgi:hydroxyacyl-ACP dehydratase HTD2-like protein with hotdog domain
MPRLSIPAVGDKLPELTFMPNEVDLFFFNAALWNGHRIHYDAPYVKDVEKYPEIVIDGLLQGDWLSQVVTNWIGSEATLLELSYSNRDIAYLGETLRAGGEVARVDPSNREIVIDLAVRNERDEITTPGEARVRWAELGSR